MPVFNAPAKINLFLHVTGKRDDGYHLLDSMVAFANDIADKVTIESAHHFDFSVSGDFAGEVPPDNLVTRAAQEMANATGKPLNISIHLEKNIPAGAGLGGGSADAAATVKGLEQFWNAPIDKDTRDAILISLGADVPVCYYGMPCRFSGIGEIIDTIPPLPALHALVVWPNRHSDTKTVFARRNADYTHPPAMPDNFETLDDFIAYLETTGNDLMKTAMAIEPTIADAADFMRNLQGCLFSRMSGSGSGVFGLFASRESCLQARNACRAAHPVWFVAASRI